MSEGWDERLVERLVTYTLEVEGEGIVVEHVPARVDEEAGERFFAPATVEKLQEIIRERREPSRVIFSGCDVGCKPLPLFGFRVAPRSLASALDAFGLGAVAPAPERTFDFFERGTDAKGHRSLDPQRTSARRPRKLRR